jgi:hypothetical protein
MSGMRLGNHFFFFFHFGKGIHGETGEKNRLSTKGLAVFWQMALVVEIYTSGDAHKESLPLPGD